MKFKISSKKINIAFILLIMFVLIYFFKMIGLRIFLAFSIFYILPFYLILGKFDLGTYEKLFFSFFMSLGTTPILIYHIGKLTTFKIGMILSFIILIIIAAILRYKELPFFSNH